MNKAILIMFAVTVFTLAGAGQPQTDSSVDPGLMPGNPFYGLEQFVEGLEVRIAGAIGGPDMKSKALANNAEERLAEANALADKNRSEEASRMIQEYSDTLNKSRKLAVGNNNSNLTEKLDTVSRKNTRKLKEVKKKVPLQAQAAIQKAIDNSNKPRDTGRPENPGNGGKIVPGKANNGNITDRPQTPESGNSKNNLTPGQRNNKDIQAPENSSGSTGKNFTDPEGRVPDRGNDSGSLSDSDQPDTEVEQGKERTNDSVSGTSEVQNSDESTDKNLDTVPGKSDDINRPGRP